MFLPSGLYRRFRNLTGSADKICSRTIGYLKETRITAGGEFHPALKHFKIRVRLLFVFVFFFFFLYVAEVKLKKLSAAGTVY